MASLSVVEVIGEPGEVGSAKLDLDTRWRGGTACRFRLARDINDLGYAHWQPVTAAGMELTWLLPGLERRAHTPVFAEVAYDAGPNLILETAATPPVWIVKKPKIPRPAYQPEPGVLFNIDCAIQAWPLTSYTDSKSRDFAPTFPFRRGNAYTPLDWHEDGYAWNTHEIRAVDGKEQPPDVVAAHFDIRQLRGAKGPADLTGHWLRTVLGGEGLKMFGGRACLAAICRAPHGPRARYHLLRPLAVGENGEFAVTDFQWPDADNPDWSMSFVGGQTPWEQMARGPDARFITGLEIIFRDWSWPPVGQFRVKQIAAQQQRFGAGAAAGI